MRGAPANREQVYFGSLHFCLISANSIAWVMRSP
jgi:hypothetical protein